MVSFYCNDSKYEASASQTRNTDRNFATSDDTDYPPCLVTCVLYYVRVSSFSITKMEKYYRIQICQQNHKLPDIYRVIGMIDCHILLLNLPILSSYSPETCNSQSIYCQPLSSKSITILNIFLCKNQFLTPDEKVALLRLTFAESFQAPFE